MTKLLRIGRWLCALVVCIATFSVGQGAVGATVVASTADWPSYYYDAPIHVVAATHPARPAATTPRANTRTAAPIRRSSPRTSPGVVYPGSGSVLAAKAETRLLGPGTTLGHHVRPEKLAERGWTERLVRRAIDDPARTVVTRDTRRIPGGKGARMDDPATANYSRRGGYVVRNDQTGDIVQISDRTDPYWKDPWGNP